MSLIRLCLYVVPLTFIFSCAFHGSNWKGADMPGKNKASFTHFKGTVVRAIEIPEENCLLYSYKVKVTEGSLLLHIENSGKRLWEKSFTEKSDTAAFSLPAEAGKYKIAVKGNNAAGSFDIDYKVLSPKKIEVTVNKNIELFGLILQLDMGPDLLNSKDTLTIDNRRATWRDWYERGFTNYLQYKQFDSSLMMAIYRNMQSKNFYNDFFISFLLQVDEVPFAKINRNTDTAAYLPFSPNGDPEEAKNKATEFLNQFNAFYNAVDFNNYLSGYLKQYEQSGSEVIANLPNEFFVSVMEDFYQKSFARYVLLPSLNIPTSMGFGKANPTTKTIYNVFGPFSFQYNEAGKWISGFNYPDRIKELSVHEFGHSFVNPAIDKLPKELVASTAYLYTPISEQMSKKAYTSWTMCLYEHFVKAGEVIIARKLGDDVKSWQILNDNEKAGFIYLPVIVQELEKYDNNKDIYKSYDEFVPSIMEKLRTLNKQ